jgi:hypothetical protein
MTRRAVVVRVSLFSALPFLSSCDSGTLWEDETYEVVWIDTDDYVSVYRKLEDGAGIGRVDPRVIAVASDDRYLTAENVSLTTGLHGFFYIDKAKDNDLLNGSEITVGPLTREEFLRKQSELGLPEPMAL